MKLRCQRQGIQRDRAVFSPVPWPVSLQWKMVLEEPFTECSFLNFFLVYVNFFLPVDRERNSMEFSSWKGVSGYHGAYSGGCPKRKKPWERENAGTAPGPGPPREPSRQGPTGLRVSPWLPGVFLRSSSVREELRNHCWVGFEGCEVIVCAAVMEGSGFLIWALQMNTCLLVLFIFISKHIRII